MNNRFFADQIKDRLNIPDVLQDYGFEVVRGRISCPFHNGKDKNLSLQSKYYKCFVCDAKGDLINFVKRFFNLSFDNAVKKLNDDFALGLPIGEKLDKRKQIDIALQSYRRNNERKHQRERTESLVNGLDDALDKVEQLEREKRKNEPHGVTELISDVYINACKDLDFARLEVENAERALYEYRSANH